MGNMDTVTKDYMKKNDIFADAFNYVIYHGVQKINPTDLHTYDSSEIALYETAKGKEHTLQLSRDELKVLTMMSDGTAVYVLLGIENQSNIHYAMPTKNLLYDAVDYHSQMRKIASMHETETKQKKKASHGEAETKQKKKTSHGEVKEHTDKISMIYCIRFRPTKLMSM